MNIFFTSFDPAECARFLDDKRLIKMILESAQMLSTAQLICNSDCYKVAFKTNITWKTDSKGNPYIAKKRIIYKNYLKNGFEIYAIAHANHPSNVWVRKSKQNYDWLVSHGLELCYEYTRRYGKIHRTQAILEELGRHSDAMPSTGMTALPNCAANKEHKLDFKSESCIYTAYKKYLTARFLGDKKPAVCKLY